MDYFAEVVERSYLDLREDGTITSGSVDKLPYTEEFDTLCEAVAYEFPDKTKNEIWLRLVNLRKQGFCRSKERTEKERTRLTFTQLKVLHLLNDNPRGLTRSQIEYKFGRKMALTATLGPMYIEDLKKAEERYNHASLMGLELVDVAMPDNPDENTVVYKINRAGKKALTLSPQAK